MGGSLMGSTSIHDTADKMGRTLGVRWNKLRKGMINLQVGPGAAVLPSTVTRIHMDFAFTMAKGHMGPRYASPAACCDTNKAPCTLDRTRRQLGSFEFVEL